MKIVTKEENLKKTEQKRKLCLELDMLVRQMQVHTFKDLVKLDCKESSKYVIMQNVSTSDEIPFIKDNVQIYVRFPLFVLIPLLVQMAGWPWSKISKTIALKREEKGDQAGGIWIELIIKMPYLIIELSQTSIRTEPNLTAFHVCSQRKALSFYIDKIHRNCAFCWDVSTCRRQKRFVIKPTESRLSLRCHLKCQILHR